jgi:hypothetical protein
VTFVDTNVVMYAVGRKHPLRAEARAFFERSLRQRAPLATSAEVLQELLHAYLPVQRMATLDAALALVESRIETVWPVEPEDVRLARLLVDRHPRVGRPRPSPPRVLYAPRRNRHSDLLTGRSRRLSESHRSDAACSPLAGC